MKVATFSIDFIGGNVYNEDVKIKLKDKLFLTVLKRISNWSYIVELRQLDSKNNIVAKGRKIVTEDELDSKKIGFFMDKNFSPKKR